MNYKNFLLVITIVFFATIITAQETKEINVNSFSVLKLAGSAQWVLIPSNKEQVVIDSKDSDVFNYIDVDQEGDMLIISTTDKNKDVTRLFKSVTINVYFRSIESVTLSGIGNVKTNSNIRASEFTATLKGTGNMYLDVTCSEFMGNMQGTGALAVVGKTDKGIVRVEGVGSFDGYDFKTTNMNVTVSGVGGAKVNAVDVLTATLNGVGSIKYSGDPVTKNLNKNGLGTIKKAKD